MVVFSCIVSGLVFVIVWAVAREALKRSTFLGSSREVLAVCVALLAALSLLQPTTGGVVAIPVIIPLLLVPCAALAGFALLLLLLSGTKGSKSWRNALARARRWLLLQLRDSSPRARSNEGTDTRREEK